MQLTSGQNKALRLALTTRDPLFITGSAGTGKTVVLQQIVEKLRAAGQNVVTTSFTGLAALQLQGTTLSRLLGLGIAKRRTDLTQDLHRVSERAAVNVGNAEVLIIDEVSLMSGDYLELVDFVLRMALGVAEPFGGLRVIFCGDFLQLPPIRGYRDPEFKTRWTFQYPAFREATPVVLTESMRQEREVDLQLLNELREGRLTKLARLFMEAAVGRKIEGAVELHPRNEAVREINERELKKLPGTMQMYCTRYESDEARQALSKSLPIDDALSLKVGAPVIVMVNQPARGYYNGTQGRVVGLSQEEVKIQTDDGLRTVVPHEWKADLGENPDRLARMTGQTRRYASAWGMPLKLGWAATIHKSQGLTLSKVRADVARCWEPGHAYVALSRATSLLDVSLTRPFKKIVADPEALAFMRSLPEN